MRIRNAGPNATHIAWYWMWGLPGRKVMTGERVTGGEANPKFAIRV